MAAEQTLITSSNWTVRVGDGMNECFCYILKQVSYRINIRQHRCIYTIINNYD